jgi:PAS domain-containing protein
MICVCSGSSISHDTQALMLLDMATPKWSIFLVNDAWQKVTGITQELAVGSHFWDLFEPPLPAQVRMPTLKDTAMRSAQAAREELSCCRTEAV